MVTLRKMSAQVIRHLTAGNKPKDSRINDKYVQEAIRRVTNTMIRREYYTTLNEGQRDLAPLCIATYQSQPVLLDTVYDRNYIVLPSFYVNLPGGVGIQQIKPQTGNVSLDKAMIPINPMELEMFSNLLVGAEVLKDQWCFEPDRRNVYFSKRDEETLLEQDPPIEFVEIKIAVVDTDQIGEDDDYPVDPSQESAIIMEVLKEFGLDLSIQPDLKNDGNTSSK